MSLISVVKYYLLGNPINTWSSTASIVIFAIVAVIYLLRWQRHYVDFTPAYIDHIHFAGAYPLLAWGLHYIPFFIMGRYFAIKVPLTLVFCTSITISPLSTLRSWWKDSCSTISRAISTQPQNGPSLQSRTSPSQEPSSTSATSHSAWKAIPLNGNISTGCEHGESPTKTLPTKSPPHHQHQSSHVVLGAGARQERKGKGVLQYVRVCILGIKYVCMSFFICCFFGYCVCMVMRVYGHFSHLEKGIYPSYESGKKPSTTRL
jgi:hypothetical protein